MHLSKETSMDLYHFVSDVRQRETGDKGPIHHAPGVGFLALRGDRAYEANDKHNHMQFNVPRH